MFYKSVLSAVGIIMLLAKVKRIIKALKETSSSQNSVTHYLHSSQEGLSLLDCQPCPSKREIIIWHAVSINPNGFNLFWEKYWQHINLPCRMVGDLVCAGFFNDPVLCVATHFPAGPQEGAAISLSWWIYWLPCCLHFMYLRISLRWKQNATCATRDRNESVVNPARCIWM